MNNQPCGCFAPHPARPLGRAIRQALRERQRPGLRLGAGSLRWAWRAGSCGIGGTLSGRTRAVEPRERRRQRRLRAERHRHNDYSGRSVSEAGDVNGDGIDDLIVGARNADPGGRTDAGESYVVFGRDQATGGFPAELELSSLLSVNGGNGSAGFVLIGMGFDKSGNSVSRVT